MSRTWPSFAVLALLLGLAVAPTPSRGARSGAVGPGNSRPRIEAARDAYTAVKAAHDTGTATAEAVYLWSGRWLSAEVEGGVPARTARAAHLGRMRALETMVRGRVTGGLATRTEALAVRYYRAEAEFWAVP
jgi:hypothetical protein